MESETIEPAVAVFEAKETVKPVPVAGVTGGVTVVVIGEPLT